MARRNDITPHSVRIPNNIDIDALLTTYPLFPPVPNARCYLLYILSRIKHKSSFTSLKSIELKKIADNYSRLLDWLVDRQILIKKNYLVKAHTNGYKFSPEYLTSLKTEHITTNTLIKKIPKRSTVKVNVVVAESENIDSGYGYNEQVYWMRTAMIAKILGLNSKKIRAGLLHFNLISDREYDHTERDDTKMFYYVFSKKNGYPTLLINSLLIEKIESLAKKYPQKFPRLKGKPPKRRYKSRNI